MLFEGLNSLKRNAIMTSILSISFSVVLLMLPVEYLPALIEAVGATMIIIALGMIFDFLSSNKTLIHYITLTLAMALVICGVAVLIFQTNVIFVLGGMFGVFLIIDGLHGISNSWIYMRRSGRQAWWMLIPLYIVLIAMGALILWNPWWSEIEVFKMIIGWVLLFSAVISIMRVVWVWPIRAK